MVHPEPPDLHSCHRGRGRSRPADIVRLDQVYVPWAPVSEPPLTSPSSHHEVLPPRRQTRLCVRTWPPGQTRAAALEQLAQQPSEHPGDGASTRSEAAVPPHVWAEVSRVALQSCVCSTYLAVLLSILLAVITGAGRTGGLCPARRRPGRIDPRGVRARTNIDHDI